MPSPVNSTYEKKINSVQTRGIVRTSGFTRSAFRAKNITDRVQILRRIIVLVQLQKNGLFELSSKYSYRQNGLFEIFSVTVIFGGRSGFVCL